MSASEASVAAAEIERILAAIAMAVPARSAAFVSGPVASGPRLYAPDAPAPSELRARNAENMERFADSLRRRLGRPVISPARFSVPGWRGRDYGELFRRVIERFAREAWFLDGWEFSTGAVREQVTCLRAGIPRLDERGRPIDHRAAVRQARRALEIASRSGIDCASLTASVRLLEGP